MVSKRIITIVGPTGSGKSALAMEIAQQFRGEIICADSRTIYRELDISSGKPTKEDQAAVKHWGLNLVDPGGLFSAHDFVRYAEDAIIDITSRKQLPLVVGGTGLYIDALLYDFAFRDTDPEKRTELEQLSLGELQTRAKKLLPGVELSQSTLGNRRYLVRMLESGKSPKSPANRQLPSNILLIGMAIKQDNLKQNLTKRAKSMLSMGAREEVVRLKRDYPDVSVQSLGNAFRILADGQNKTDEQCVAEIVQADQQLAKKQVTWFKRDPNIMWVDSAKDGLALARDFLQQEE